MIGECFTDDTKRKQPMSICVSKNDLFYILSHPLFPFSHSQLFGVPVTHWVFPAYGWNNHGEYPQHVLACTDDVSVKNMSQLARMSHTCWINHTYTTNELTLLHQLKYNRRRSFYSRVIVYITIYTHLHCSASL